MTTILLIDRGSDSKSTIYTVFEKRGTLDLGHNVCKCRPIFKISSLTDSQRNSVCDYVMEDSTSPKVRCYITLSNLRIQNNCVSKTTCQGLVKCDISRILTYFKLLTNVQSESWQRTSLNDNSLQASTLR